MSKYKGPHARLNFKKAVLYGEQQGFGPFRQRFTPQPKVKKTAPSAANAGEGRKTQKPNQYIEVSVNSRSGVRTYTLPIPDDFAETAGTA